MLTHLGCVQPIFRVMGFSVTGRVLNSLGGEGVPDASVSINNQIKGTCSQKTVVSRKRRGPCTTGLTALFSPPSHHQRRWFFQVGEHDSWHLHHPCQQGAHVLRANHGEDCAQHPPASRHHHSRVRLAWCFSHMFNRNCALRSFSNSTSHSWTDVGSPQIQRLRADLGQPPAWGHEAARTL